MVRPRSSPLRVFTSLPVMTPAEMGRGFHGFGNSTRGLRNLKNSSFWMGPRTPKRYLRQKTTRGSCTRLLNSCPPTVPARSPHIEMRRMPQFFRQVLVSRIIGNRPSTTQAEVLPLFSAAATLARQERNCCSCHFLARLSATLSSKGHPCLDI